MTTTLTRRRALERDRRQPTLFSQVVSPPARREESLPAPRREEERPRQEPPREEAARVEAPPVTAQATTASSRTLDEALSALWDELTTGTEIDCPVCGGAMEPRHSAGAGVVGGRCGTCATTLA
jgi:hypothetical protein